MRFPLSKEHFKLSFYLMRAPLRNELRKSLVPKSPFFLAGYWNNEPPPKFSQDNG